MLPPLPSPSHAEGRSIPVSGALPCSAIGIAHRGYADSYMAIKGPSIDIDVM